MSAHNSRNEMSSGAARSKKKLKKNGRHSPSTQRSIQEESVTSNSADHMAKIKVTSGEKGSDLFPRHLDWLLCVVLLVYRINYVLTPTNWWILHPDEVFQTIEVAHTDAFGFGFRPYEYLPPAEGNQDNATILSAARVQEIDLGMFSLRSFILPKLISNVLIFAEKLGSGMSPFLVGKLLHVLITSCLPLSVSKFALVMHGSHDVAMMSAIFVSCSVTLNVFGTHSLINSFLAPFLFYALCPLVDILRDHIEDASETSDRSDIDENGKLFASCKPRKRKSNEFEIKSNEYYHTNNNNYAKECFEGLTKSNGHIPSKTIPEYKTLSFYECYINQLKLIFAKFLQNNLRLLMAGLLLAICVYIRIDLILVPLLVTIIFCNPFFKNPRILMMKLRVYVLGIVTGVLIGGYVDCLKYGTWFLSPRQWFNFNVWNKYADKIYGEVYVSYYLEKLYDQEPYVLGIFALILLNTLFVLKEMKNNKSMIFSADNLNPCSIVLAALFALYSLNGHKELRFLHTAIVLLYISASSAIVKLIDIYRKYFQNQKEGQYCIYLFITLYASSHIYAFQNVGGDNISKWSYAKNAVSHEVNICLDFIGRQSDVTGVFMDRPLHMTGAYSIIHKAVPLMALNNFEFLEFDKNLNLPDLPTNFIGRGVSTFGLVSEFISVYNTPYLLKHLIKKQEYNYLVLKSDRQFVEVGYKEVFRHNDAKVVKRTFTKESEKALMDMAKDIPLGTNSTVLEYEGDWLMHYGCYNLAEKRLLAANRLDTKRLGPFQALMKMFKKLGNDVDYFKVLEACMQVFPKHTCEQPYAPVQLHKGYYKQKGYLNKDKGVWKSL